MPEPAAVWRVGDVVDGRYEVLRVHEQGGMGLVYRVRHREWAVDLAVKSPRPEVPQDAFVAEAETWVSLGLHPHVCSCYYVRVLDGVPRAFAEYVAGGSLRDWIDDRRLYRGSETTAVERILDAAVQTAWALAHAHDRSVTHRDVKPANILLDDTDGAFVAKLTDFGLAAGGGMTLAYASPEQASGAPAGPPSDVYSLAVSILEMFTGGVTWMAGPAARHALSDHRARNPRPAPPAVPERAHDPGHASITDGAGDRRPAAATHPARGPHLATAAQPTRERHEPDGRHDHEHRDVGPAMPTEVADLLDRCLAEAPGDRPASAAEVAGALVTAYERHTGRAYPRAAPVAAVLRADELSNRGLSLLDLDRPAEAEQAFARALAADPQHVAATYNAGLHRWRRGAVTDDRLVAEVEGLRADTGDVLAQIHLERGDLTAARGLLGEAGLRAGLPTAGTLVDAGVVAAWTAPWTPVDDVPGRVPLAGDPGGRLALTGEPDGALRLWDIRSGRVRHRLTGHRRRVHAAGLTPDGRYAVSVCEDETVRHWDLTPRRPRGRLLYASPNPPRWGGGDGLGELALRTQSTAVGLSPDGRLVLFAGLDGVLRVRDMRGGPPRTLDEHAGARLVAVSADGRSAVSVGLGHVARVWDLPAGRCRRELALHPSPVAALGLGADGRFAAVGYLDGTIGVWDLGDGRRIRVLTGGAPADALSLDDRVLVSAERYHGTVRYWDLDSGRCLRTFPGHTGGAAVVHLDADSRSVLSAGRDGAVRRWRLPGEYRAAPRLSRPRRTDELHRLGTRVEALVAEAERAAADGRLATALDRLRQARAVPGHERASRVMAAWWALGRGAVRTGLRTAWSSRYLTGHTRDVGAVDLSADGRIAVSGGCDATVRLWDLDDGACVRILAGHEHMVEAVCLSGDGRRALSSSRDGTVRLWDLGTGECLRVMTGNVHMRESVPVRFTAGDSQAIVAGRDGRIRIWDLDTGDLRHELRGGAAFRALRLGSGDRLAAAARGDMVQLWDLHTGQCLHRLRGGFLHTMRSVSLSADGRLALTGENDEGLRLWDTTTGTVVRTFGGAQNTPDAVALTADGRVAVSCGYTDFVSVWDATDGRRLRVLDGHERGATCLALTPDGRYVLSGHRDGGLRRWELDWDLEMPAGQRRIAT
ncbi:protein kinase [Dactylosporangium sp. AC04546]|uniref:protein kinase domain-containing protein n=1 Tax=Dactylosporangium sp. AC04546 TaxID=2862460 RepID=UPI001EDD619E|nr:protein kinase [Dactylosporangium sp. AC04546]WVK88904.1 protein kinase [Dactylosporangium sp. AC04546]